MNTSDTASVHPPVAGAPASTAPSAAPDISARFASVGASRTFRRILDTFDLRHKKVLDMGCGYGEYLAHFGEGSIGITTTVAEVEYGKAHGLAIAQGNVERIDQTAAFGQTFEAMWANNLFEHLRSPHAFLIKLKPIATDGSIIILGVPVVPRIASLMGLKKFRGALAGAHINFFTRETLRLTVERSGWRVSHIRPFVFSNMFLDMLASFFAPHLYAVATNDASFRYPVKKLKEWQDDQYYTDLLAIAGPRA